MLAVPLSLLGDRWGRVKSIVLMATIWSLATLGSAIAANYEQLMLARVFIGVGEAAYGSVGLAVVLAVFPVYRRASLTGAFLAGGSFGSVLGVALGGALAVQFGWRWSFAAMAIVGLVLVVLYRMLISDKKLDRYRVADAADSEPVAAAGGAGQAAHPVQHSVGDRRLRRQRSAAVHRRFAVRLAAQLPGPRLRPGTGQGRRHRRDRHPAHGRRHDRLRCGHRPARRTRGHPQMDVGDRLHRGIAGLPRHRLLADRTGASSC